MKKIFTTTILLLTIIYVIPFIYTGYGYALNNSIKGDTAIHIPFTSDLIQNNSQDKTNVSNTDMSEEILKEKNIITVYKHETDEVIEVELEEYLYGVVAAEMPPTFELEALKAQAVAARTYIMYKKYGVESGKISDDGHKGAIICDDSTHCKAHIDIEVEAENLWKDNSEEYLNKIKLAVDSTAGQIITYSNIPIAAVFHSVSAEKTENASDVWGSTTPYLTSVVSPGGEQSPNYSKATTFTADEFRQKFEEKYENMNLNDKPANWFKASNRSEAGGIIDVMLGGIRISGDEVRSVLDLNSTNFTISTTENSITITTLGYGHGVGMSQYGANYLAKEGNDYTEILSWYYVNTQLQNISDN